MGRHFADELFHLVGHADPQDDEHNFHSLVSILQDGWISHPPHAKGCVPITLTYNRKKSLLDGELVVPEMVSFCDIPHEHLHDHVANYGRFGLSVNKRYAISVGTRPVTYVPFWSGDSQTIYGSTMLRDIEAAYRGFEKHILGLQEDGERPSRILTQMPDSPAGAADAVQSIFVKEVLAFLKPFNSDLRENDPDYFYAEKEWRLLGNLKLEHEHVRHIVIAAGFEGRLAEAVPGYADKPMIMPNG